MGKTNRAWHEQNRMPERATLQQRIAWHQEHAEHCSCRPMPKSVISAMKASGASGRQSPLRKKPEARP